MHSHLTGYLSGIKDLWAVQGYDKERTAFYDVKIQVITEEGIPGLQRGSILESENLTSSSLPDSIIRYSNGDPTEEDGWIPEITVEDKEKASAIFVGIKPAENADDKHIFFVRSTIPGCLLICIVQSKVIPFALTV